MHIAGDFEVTELFDAVGRDAIDHGLGSDLGQMGLGQALMLPAEGLAIDRQADLHFEMSRLAG